MAINPKFNKPLRLKEPLQEICGGEASLPRYEIVKRVWAYIKAHKLQDSKDKRMIINDDKMRAAFGCKKMSMFEMAKHMSHGLEGAKAKSMKRKAKKAPCKQYEPPAHRAYKRMGKRFCRKVSQKKKSN